MFFTHLHVCGHWGRPQTWFLENATNVDNRLSTFVAGHKRSHNIGNVRGHVTYVAISIIRIPDYWQQLLPGTYVDSDITIIAGI